MLEHIELCPRIRALDADGERSPVLVGRRDAVASATNCSAGGPARCMRSSVTFTPPAEAAVQHRGPSRTSGDGGFASGDIVAAVCLIAFALTGIFLLRVGIDSLDEGYFVEQAVRVLHG